MIFICYNHIKEGVNLKIKSAIYGFVIGDAMGVPIEFEDREKLMKSPVTNMLGYGSYDVPKGVWSDDTSMTLATMDSIIVNKNKLNYNDIADKFCEWINNAKYTATNEVFDIGTTTKYSLMRYWNNKIDATKCGGNAISENGNGSLMRMLPIACYCFYNKTEDNDIINIVRNTSSITHAHEISIIGCYMYVKYIIFILSNNNKTESYKLLQKIDYSIFNKDNINLYERIIKYDISKYSLDTIKSTGFVVDTLESALWVILNTESFNEAIIGSVNLGGDTDTIAAITGSIAGILYGYDSINEKWIKDIKNKELLSKYIYEFTNTLNL